MKLFLTIILLCANCGFLIARQPLVADTSSVEVRSFNDDKLKELKKNKDFQYVSLTEPSKTLWEKFWDWAWWRVHEVTKTKRGRATVWTILIGFGIAAIIFFVVKVTEIKSGGLFLRNGADNFPYTTGTEDINQISFDEAIKEEIESRNFRMATRLLYLQCLKQLSDKGYIQWQINKTNNDYIVELSGRPWQSLFKKLTYSFECSWYGQEVIGNDEFKNLQVQFQQFNNQLQ